MKCWNCDKEVSEEAKECPFCEADLKLEAEDSGALEQAAKAFMDMLPVEMRDELTRMMSGSETADDFVNAIMLGECPACGSSNVHSCETEPEYKDVTLGKCADCATVWCSECEYVLKDDERACPNQDQHTWGDFDDESFLDEDEDASEEDEDPEAPENSSR